jgi:hypothetical protein
VGTASKIRPRSPSLRSLQDSAGYAMQMAATDSKENMKDGSLHTAKCATLHYACNAMPNYHISSTSSSFALAFVVPFVCRVSMLLTIISRKLICVINLNKCIPVTPTLRRHTNSLPSRLRILQKFPQLRPRNLHALRTGGTAHLHDRAPEVERVSDVGRDTEHDEEDEVYRVSQNWNPSLACPPYSHHML